MSLWGDFWGFIQGKLLGGGSYTVTSDDIASFIDGRKWRELSFYEFALHSGINIIANALSACEVRTFRNWKEVREDQYYRWNYEPNINMNSNQFMQKLIWTLIYKNECLVIQGRKGDFIIADSFTKKQTSVYNRVVFENVTVTAEGGELYTFQKNFWMDDVLYYRLSNKNVIGLLNSLTQGYQDLLQTAIDKFNKSGGERGVLKIDANATTVSYGVKEDGSPRTFNDVYTDLLNKQFAGYFKNANAVLPLFKNFDYEVKGGESNKKSTSEIKDVTDITDQIYSKVANALQIPPALLRGDVADVTALTRNLITFAIEPIAKMIATENNRKLYKEEVLEGNYQMIDTSSIMHLSVSELSVAADKMLGSGWTMDEIRRKTGDPILNTEESRKRYVTLNYAELSVTDSDSSQDDEDKSNSEKGGNNEEDA